jgi:hypothetical protein
MVLYYKGKTQINFLGTKTIVAILTAVSLISLQLLLIQNPLEIYGSSSVDGSNNNVAFTTVVDQVGGKPVAIKLNYAHFVPLTNNTKLHQVKTIVLYTSNPSIMDLRRVQNAVMKVYALNGTLLRTTSYPNGLTLNATNGKAQLATTLMDSTIKNITASVVFTDSSKSANYSNVLSVNLGLGQIIQP